MGESMTDTTLKHSHTTAASVQPILKNAAIALAGSALVALCAHIAIPLGFTPVPVTLQPFAVLLLGLLLGPAMGFAALALYLVEGASGLPVFNPHGPGGLLQLLGPTGGYLLAAPFAAAIAGVIYRIGHTGKRLIIRAILGALAGDAVLLSVGALWLGMLEHTHASLVLAQSVVPFLGSDAVQLLAAAVCAVVLRSFTQPCEPLLRG
jgi:biotin transport system substrate-specific component